MNGWMGGSSLCRGFPQSVSETAEKEPQWKDRVEVGTHIALHTFGRSDTPDLRARGQSFIKSPMFYIPADITMHKGMFWEVDDTLWGTYLNVLCISSELGAWKTLG